MSAGLWHHSDNRDLDRDGAAYLLSSLEVRHGRMRNFRNPHMSASVLGSQFLATLWLPSKGPQECQTNRGQGFGEP